MKNKINLCLEEQEALVGFICVHRTSCFGKSIELRSESPSGIGYNLFVVCAGCHEEADITDYSKW